MGGIVGPVVLPAPPEHTEPCAGEADFGFGGFDNAGYCRKLRECCCEFRPLSNRSKPKSFKAEKPVLNRFDDIVEQRLRRALGAHFHPKELQALIGFGSPLAHSDFDNKNVGGDAFGTITPQVNWYLSDNVRLEANYGYGHLDRFGLSGNTQFFQTRVQLQF